ncbi:MAG: DUF3050 domain-containing protein [Zunongwangia sp.]|uniref:Heme oxygenase-like protein n=2 Tax=Zunongwangia profunda TaxID=398743 RepID=D5BEY8_ZUNPS|nr:DUF3050 domain-containing protein [Zunongwangia profunda]MAO36021.1 DUF3050 domain-containing protein [Zunongwangia sp.]ADF50867.1 heme oxygenase-like protein [Zunongwangia profunda SM-A87]MAS72434.1 DUF3050 domain-containing protein [Zunongwangia sp.]HAJ82251.1 DUF3050 domain-containing protein [Zunongwangia profunda]HCV82561.1 DUF3050 domain-containing protein [Zunongwangia profunda]
MIKDINKALKPQVETLLNHSLYSKVRSPKELQVFMEHHVFAVWDFMSLLKALQQNLTKTTNPWFPVGNPETRYLINEIVLAEETDVNFYGKHQSHYEMYIDAMEKAGANTTKIHSFLDQVIHGTDIYLIIAASDLPWSIKQFLKFTFETISEGKPHKIASAFTFGREGLIPGMFTSIIGNIQKNFPEKDLQLFKYYFDRHIELDDDEHGPMAFEMIEHLCGKDTDKWQEVETIAKQALDARIELWDGIEREIELLTNTTANS